MVVDRKP